MGQQVAEPRKMPPAQESVFSEENIPEHTIDQDSGAIWKNNSVCGMPSSGRRIEFLLLRESENAEAGALRETNQSHLGCQQASPSHVLLAEAAAFPLHNTLPVNILPAACVPRLCQNQYFILDQVDHCLLMEVPVLEVKLETEANPSLGWRPERARDWLHCGGENPGF